MSGASHPTQPDQWHELRFEPVTTRALRATIHGQRNGGYFHSVFVSEWEVHGVQARVLPVVEVAVKDGRPELPQTAELEFPGAGLLPVKVLWRDLPVGSEARASGNVAEGRAIGQAAGFIRARPRGK